jgi:hypothetical protein
MPRASGSQADKVVASIEGEARQGAQKASKSDVQVTRASSFRPRSRTFKFFYNRTTRVGFPAFIMGFLACAVGLALFTLSFC